MTSELCPPLRALGLGFRYGSGQPPVLDDVDVVLDRGAITAITGHSGSGKSTLLMLMGLLLVPTGGRLELMGQGTEHLRDHHRSMIRGSQIGFLFQDALLDPSRTVLDNILEGVVFAGQSPRRMRAQATALLERVGLDPGLLLERRPTQISGGQGQRVALCRALVKSPVIVLADEPTGNLDRDSASVVLSVLREVADDGIAVAIATHDPMIAEVADAVLDLG